MADFRKALLILSIFGVFAAGFLTGAYYTAHKENEELTLKYKKAALSKKRSTDKKLPEAEISKVIMGYVQDFRDPASTNYKNLTHVIFSFAHPTTDGKVMLNGEMAWENLRRTVKLAHKNGSSALLAIGGWYHINGGESYPYFKEAISSPQSRNNLVASLMAIVDKENLDGIDIDFEHPRSQTDAANLAVFAKELSGELHGRKKELSVAVYSKINAISGAEVNSVTFKADMFRYADHVNIMAYDGQWDGGYHAENLAPYQFTKNVVNYWAKLFGSLGISKSKLVLGIPLYGQPEDVKAKQISYAAIVRKNPDYAKKDSINWNGTVYHFNGQNTVKRKTELALSHGFGGMMLWEAGLDSNDEKNMAAAIRSTLTTHSIRAGNSPGEN
ncbi:glycoside hydrolase family 18 protein [Bacillus sp. B-jedd]|uniref:glycoside hydrolase family 18 protein n=1 Tax=Bacillus sp. B-jedd TaxID=1476857 RepID=UPI0005155449|nr:glycoside hydrolase family 18 protein [Bacillus sp. B-jedd]CEG27416.1 glycoside hydrolase family 18 protein [Bacillus sp. B-jedd]